MSFKFGQGPKPPLKPSQEQIALFLGTIPENNRSWIKKTFEAIPDRFKKQYMRVMTGKGSPRVGIKMKCLDCSAYSDILNSIGKCPSVTCPLWPFRPFQNSKSEEEVSADEQEEDQE